MTPINRLIKAISHTTIYYTPIDAALIEEQEYQLTNPPYNELRTT